MPDFLENLVQNIQQISDTPKIEKTEFEHPKPEWLYDYCVDVIGFEDMRPQPHYELCNALEWAVNDCRFEGDHQRALMILLPRDTFKTSISVEALSSAVLTQNPNARILITSHKAKQASQRLVAARKTFDRNETFMDKYGDDWAPERREEKWSDSEFTIAKRTKVNLREPSVQAAAVGADVTGSHYDLIIADDLVNLENCYTQESRDKVYDYLVSLFPHLEPGGTLLIVGTRWHSDDAYGRLIKRDEERVRRGQEPRYRKLIRGCYDGPAGLFFPTRLTHDFLNVIKVDMGPRRFAANYLNQTLADEDKVFDPQYLREVEFTWFRQGRGNIVRTENGQYPVYATLAWDTAGTKATSKSDYHGITIRGLDSEGHWWIPEALGKKGTPTEIVNLVASYVLEYRIDKVLIEAVGSYQTWVDALTAKLEPTGHMPAITEVQHKGIPKQERIVMLQIPWQNRKIVFRPGLTTLKEQLDNFSMTSLPTHDDEMDSLSMHWGQDQAVLDGHVTEVNPVDPEWLKREQRRKSDRRAGSWRRGTSWGV